MIHSDIIVVSKTFKGWNIFIPPSTIVGIEYHVLGLSKHASSIYVSVWCSISVLGGIRVKLCTNIHHASGVAEKVFKVRGR